MQKHLRNFRFYFRLLLQFGHHPGAEVTAHVSAIVLLDHLRAGTALLGNRLDVLARSERKAYKRVPGAVEIPLPDLLRAERPVPVILAPLIGVDRPALSILETA